MWQQWPARAVIDRIEALPEFGPAVTACANILQRHGIVIPVCKGGNHRAPTVAARVGANSPNAYTVHCTISHMTFDQVMLIIRSCFRTKVPLATYSKILRSPALRYQLCLGWPWEGFKEAPEERIPAGIPFAEWEEDEYNDEMLVVTLTSGMQKSRVPFSWTLPVAVVRRSYFRGRRPW